MGNRIKCQGRAHKDKAESKSQQAPVITKAAMPSGGPCRSILQLQRHLGNQAVGRFIQAKLQVGQPGDVYEQEANCMADWVIDGQTQRAIRPHLSSLTAPAHVQRLASNRSPSLEDIEVLEGEPEGEGRVPVIQRLTQTASSNGTSPVSAKPTANLARRLATSQSGGQPLMPGISQFMEERFQAGFSNVRIHTDSEAVRLSGDLDARAFTCGTHVYFSLGEYRPETASGRKVLAHELAHVIQQGGAKPRPEVSTAPRLPPLHRTSPSVQKLSELSQTTPENLVQPYVAPWGGIDPQGNSYRVQTDAGSDVIAWVAYGGYPVNLRYWCHGFSLGTFDQSMYSVYSGPPMETVVQDECQSVPPHTAQRGDIAVWLPGYDHSARFTSVAVSSGGTLDEEGSRLDTKNGQESCKNDSLTGIMSEYGSNYGVFRRR